MVPFATFMLFLVATASAASEPPPYECLDPPGNNEIANLVASILNASRLLVAEGIPAYGIPPLDPMGPFPHIGFHIDVPGARMDFDLNDTLVMNLAEFIICQLNVTVGIKQKFDLDLMLDNLHVQGYYNLDGTVAAIFPVFGAGTFTMDVNNTGMIGQGKLSLNVITGRITLSDFILDIFFETIDLELDAIFGGGEMADLVNSVIDKIAPPMFDAVWSVMQPIFSQALEDGINLILKNITGTSLSIVRHHSDNILSHIKKEDDIGNANLYLDIVMKTVDALIKASGFDPLALPNVTLTVLDAEVKLYTGELSGLSTIHRTGSATLDQVADWSFLYANIGVEELSAHLTANVKDGTIVEIDAKVNGVDIYFVARRNDYTGKSDMDQFVITNFGHIDVNIDGLGPLDYLAGPLSEAVANLLRGTISDLLETSIKDFILGALDETPWPLLQ